MIWMMGAIMCNNLLIPKSNWEHHHRHIHYSALFSYFGMLPRYPNLYHRSKREVVGCSPEIECGFRLDLGILYLYDVLGSKVMITKLQHYNNNKPSPKPQKKISALNGYKHL